MGGVVLMSSRRNIVDSKAGAAVIYGLLAGAAERRRGRIVGTSKGVETVFTVTGRPQAEIARYWVELSAYSREGRIKEPLTAGPPAPVPRPSAGIEAPPSAGAQASSRGNASEDRPGAIVPFRITGIPYFY